MFGKKKDPEPMAFTPTVTPAPVVEPELSEDEKKIIEVMRQFPVRKVVRAFRTNGGDGWGLARVKEYELDTEDGHPLGMLCQFFSDGSIIDYPFAVLTLGEESFVLDVDKKDVIRELWPVGTQAMANMVGKGWTVCTVDRHTEYGIGLKMNDGDTSFPWEGFTDDGRCSELMRVDQRRRR